MNSLREKRPSRKRDKYKLAEIFQIFDNINDPRLLQIPPNYCGLHCGINTTCAMIVN